VEEEKERKERGKKPEGGLETAPRDKILERNFVRDE
jgi:hypothetical protein